MEMLKNQYPMDENALRNWIDKANKMYLLWEVLDQDNRVKFLKMRILDELDKNIKEMVMNTFKKLLLDDEQFEDCNILLSDLYISH